MFSFRPEFFQGVEVFIEGTRRRSTRKRLTVLLQSYFKSVVFPHLSSPGCRASLRTEEWSGWRWQLQAQWVYSHVTVHLLFLPLLFASISFLPLSSHWYQPNVTVTQRLLLTCHFNKWNWLDVVNCSFVSFSLSGSFLLISAVLHTSSHLKCPVSLAAFALSHVNGIY